MKKLAYTFVLLTAIMGTSIVTLADTSKADDKTVQTEVAVEAKEENKEGVTAEEAIALLKAGNEKFVKDQSEQNNISSERREELKEGQAPYAVVVSCSDSRVTPSHLFNVGLGEIFEIRVAGNVLDDMALGSVEYGAEHLGCPVIVVMGHENCGAVTATYEAVTKKQKVEGHIASIVEEITPSVEETKASSVEDASHANVEHVIAQIKEDETIAKLIKESKVKVVGAYYTLDGKVTFLEEAEEEVKEETK